MCRSFGAKFIFNLTSGVTPGCVVPSRWPENSSLFKFNKYNGLWVS